MKAEDLSNRFTFHPASRATGPQYDSVRSMCHELAVELDSICPDSRELSLAITHLEEVMFWANAAVARNR